MGSTLVKNLYSKVLITLGMEYLDTLTSLKFDLIPMEDRVYVRDTVYHMANTCNFFMGACADGLNKSLQDYIDDCHKANRREVELPSIINTGLEFQTLPKAEQIDDMYADFLVKHANELDPYLILIKPSEIRGDEEYVCKVLTMIVNQSIKLDKEIEIPSRKYVVEL
jgi:hypothetical protein